MDTAGGIGFCVYAELGFHAPGVVLFSPPSASAPEWCKDGGGAAGPDGGSAYSGAAGAARGWASAAPVRAGAPRIAGANDCGGGVGSAAFLVPNEPPCRAAAMPTLLLSCLVCPGGSRLGPFALNIA